MARENKRLHLHLSFLTPTDSRRRTCVHKSPRNFAEPNGVVGLGILVALNDDRDLLFSKGTLGAVHAISPKSASNPIAILGKFKKKCCGRKEGMEVCEEYTCVMSHFGKNLIAKREYFEAGNLGGNDDNGSVFSGNGGDGEIETADFLSSCFLCQKLLHGLDVFMYSGDKAFCSAECRYRQISMDEQNEKCHSGGRTPMEYSVSPCSVAAA